MTYADYPDTAKNNARRALDHKKNGSSSYSTIRVTKKEDIKKIGNFIYKDGKNIGLLRKYEKFLKIIE